MIVVLGILAAVVVYALGGVAGKTVVSSCRRRRRRPCRRAVAAYQAQNAASPLAIDTSGTASNQTLGSHINLPGEHLPADVAPEHRVQLRHQRRCWWTGSGDHCNRHDNSVVRRDVHAGCESYREQLQRHRLRHRRNLVG